MTRGFTVGVITRMDQGGLSAQGQQIVRLLDPEVVVCVDAESWGRGESLGIESLPHPDRAQMFSAQNPNVRAVANHLGGCDVVWTAETWHWPSLASRLASRRQGLRLHVNPELFKHAEHTVSYALPTTWEQTRMGLPVVPHPTPVGEEAFDRLCAINTAKDGPVTRVLHVAAPAMLDRNGSRVVLAALEQYVGPPFTLVVAGSWTRSRTPRQRQLDSNVAWPRRVGEVTIEQRGIVEDRAALYEDVDLLVLPRRYGGQALVANEAAAAGLPVVMSDVEPQRSWEGVQCFPVGRTARQANMLGGRFAVHEPDPASLADVLHMFALKASLRAERSAAARGWAESIAWPQVRGQWETWLHPDTPPVQPAASVERRNARRTSPRRVPDRRPVGPPYRQQ